MVTAAHTTACPALAGHHRRRARVRNAGVDRVPEVIPSLPRLECLRPSTVEGLVPPLGYRGLLVEHVLIDRYRVDGVGRDTRRQLCERCGAAVGRLVVVHRRLEARSAQGILPRLAVQEVEEQLRRGWTSGL